MTKEESPQNKRSVSDNAETGSATVTVASKLPSDFVLQLHDKVEKHEPVLGGGVRAFHIYQKRHGAPVYVINGVSWAQNKGPHQQISSGYALTHDIPKAFWDEWLEQQGESEVVKNSMIFAHTQNASVMSMAKENEKCVSNMERLDPANLPKNIQTSDMRRSA